MEPQTCGLTPHGIWTAEPATAYSYPEDGNDLCFSLEEESFWFKHRNAVVTEALRRWPPGGMFELGGGNGHVASALERAGWPTVVVEPGRRGAENARSRGWPGWSCPMTGERRLAFRVAARRWPLRRARAHP